MINIGSIDYDGTYFIPIIWIYGNYYKHYIINDQGFSGSKLELGIFIFLWSMNRNGKSNLFGGIYKNGRGIKTIQERSLTLLLKNIKMKNTLKKIEEGIVRCMNGEFENNELILEFLTKKQAILENTQNKLVKLNKKSLIEWKDTQKPIIS